MFDIDHRLNHVSHLMIQFLAPKKSFSRMISENSGFIFLSVSTENFRLTYWINLSSTTRSDAASKNKVINTT